MNALVPVERLPPPEETVSISFQSMTGAGLDANPLAKTRELESKAPR